MGRSGEVESYEVWKLRAEILKKERELSCINQDATSHMVLIEALERETFKKDEGLRKLKLCEAMHWEMSSMNQELRAKDEDISNLRRKVADEEAKLVQMGGKVPPAAPVPKAKPKAVMQTPPRIGRKMDSTGAAPDSNMDNSGYTPPMKVANMSIQAGIQAPAADADHLDTLLEEGMETQEAWRVEPAKQPPGILDHVGTALRAIICGGARANCGEDPWVGHYRDRALKAEAEEHRLGGDRLKTPAVLEHEAKMRELHLKKLAEHHVHVDEDGVLHHDHEHKEHHPVKHERHHAVHH